MSEMSIFSQLIRDFKVLTCFFRDVVKWKVIFGSRSISPAGQVAPIPYFTVSSVTFAIIAHVAGTLRLVTQTYSLRYLVANHKIRSAQPVTKLKLPQQDVNISLPTNDQYPFESVAKRFASYRISY
jgi:hypothetical protein